MRASLPRRGFLVLALAFALSLALALPSVAGTWSPAGVSLAAPTAGGADVLSRAWSWLTALWPDAGCGADPSGKLCGGVAQVTPKAGCGSDPNGGRCRPPRAAVRPLAGCGSDPSGGNCGTTVPRPGSSAQAPRRISTAGQRQADGRH
jgi:hypothetical protein